MPIPTSNGLRGNGYAFLLQACDTRLCSMLGSTADWPVWLALADRYGLCQLRAAAAERVLTDLVKHFSKEERQEALEKMSRLSAGTYRVLFETTLGVAASYHAELACLKDNFPPRNKAQAGSRAL